MMETVSGDDGTTCIDIDECSQGSDDCSLDASCDNTPGGFTCICNDGFFGDGRNCQRPRSCADLLAFDSAAGTGIHRIDPDEAGPLAPFDVFCDMEREGGGWTLILVSSDDSTDTWTMEARTRMTTDTEPIGDLAQTNRDFKSPAYHSIPFRSLLFVHQPSVVTAAYDDVSDSTRDFGSFLADIAYPVCDFALAGNGHPQTGGTLTLQGSLCDTDLYFNLGDHEFDNIATCSDPINGSNNTTFGPGWSGANNNDCPFDDPSFFALGPQEQCAQCAPGSRATELGSRGFGNALGLNTGVLGAGENFLQMYVR